MERRTDWTRHPGGGPSLDAEEGASVVAAGDVLRVELSARLLPALAPLLARLRRLFDLDADPTRLRRTSR